ncbi:MAG: hypothetical protein HZA95_00610 [Candidatus Vogelbacteria bacterium]|nr:hypothetical protein [Candidatus Vogelbacteria bacterium]
MELLSDLIYIDDYGLLGKNFYWRRREVYNVTEEELKTAGILNDRVQVHVDIIEPLKVADKKFQERGMRIFIQEGWRPEALYRLIKDKRTTKEGKDEIDKLFNFVDMPHALGRSVYICPWDPIKDAQIYTRKGEDGNDALFVDFYKDKHDALSGQYQELQVLMINTMISCGFRLGTKREYFHFDYRPDEPENYGNR